MWLLPAAGAKVLLLDKGNKLGRKLGISGGGRCNVTNAQPLDILIKHIPGNGRFLYSALANFGNQEIIRFFEEMGIRLKEEDRGRMFPVSDKAKTVVNALVRKVRQQGVIIRTHSPVQKINFEDDRITGVQLANGEWIQAASVIVATGGCSVPHTGSTGDGYKWAKSAGHTITDLYPTEVPITSSDHFIRSKQLQGLSLRNIVMTVWNKKGKKIIEHEGDMIFTHFGISGPVALRCSQFVVKQLKQAETKSVKLTIDLFPDMDMNEVHAMLTEAVRQGERKVLKNVLKQLLPERMIPVLLEMAQIPPEVTYHHLPRKPWLHFVELVKKFPIEASGTLPIEDAFVTGGGVHLKEIDPRTMQSKLKTGLYFCGEILDVHGYTGGYNITAAFSTGYTAGKSAAEQASRMYYS